METILVITLQLLRRSTNSGYPHDLDQVLRHRGGEALLKAKMRFYDFKRRLGDKGSEVRIFILSNMESMTMLMLIPMMIMMSMLLAIEAFAKFSVGVRLV